MFEITTTTTQKKDETQNITTTHRYHTEGTFVVSAVIVKRLYSLNLYFENSRFGAVHCNWCYRLKEDDNTTLLLLLSVFCDVLFCYISFCIPPFIFIIFTVRFRIVVVNLFFQFRCRFQISCQNGRAESFSAGGGSCRCHFRAKSQLDL